MSRDDTGGDGVISGGDAGMSRDDMGGDSVIS